MATQIEKRVVTAAQYEGLVRPSPPVSAEELFEHQLERLVDKKLIKRKDADPLRAKLPTDGKLFLLMPPEPETLDLSDLMAKVELNGKTGVNYLNVKHLKNLIKVPKGAHLLVNIEDGHERRNTASMVSREKIKKEGRQPYTTFRGIVHAIVFPYVLSRHYLDLVGSQYGSAVVPRLCLNGDHPGLDYGGFGGDYASTRWGAPSCGSVIEA